MVAQNEGTSKTSRETASGVLLIAGALSFILVMMHHPTTRSLLDEEHFARQARLNVLVHGLALAAIPILFLGLMGLSRRLGPSDLAIAALVVFGFGGVAVMSSAVASGFVATGVAERMLSAEADARTVQHALLSFTGQLNHGYTTVYVLASSTAIVLWSAAILKGGRMSRAAGALGVLVGGGGAVAFLSGHLGLDVHGFGLLALAQSAWLLWIGALLCRGGEARGPA